MKNIFLNSVVLLFLGSCSLDYPPEDQVTDPDAITSVTSAKRALASAYTSYKDYLYALDIVALSDDLQPTPLLAKSVNLKNTYFWNAENSLPHLADNIWKSNYETIAKVNVLLERLPNITGREDEVATIETQANYLKALCYFQLLRLFSPAFGQHDVAKYGLLLKDNFVLTKQQERVSQTESVAEILNLLKGKINTDEIKFATTKAAKYLQAELCLWQGNYQQALDIAYPLYEEHRLVLENENPREIWSNSKTELRLFTIENYGVLFFNELEYSQKTGDFLKVNTKIEYEDTDVRKDNYTLPFTMNTGNGDKQVMLLGKYCKMRRENIIPDSYTKIRVAGLVFLCAEAYTKIGNDKKALEILNHFLSFRGSSLLPKTLMGSELLESILDEKQKEFIGEPERFYDLKRNLKNVRKFTSTSSYEINHDDYRWTLPIPLSEIKHNIKITQNKGWESINIK